MGDLTVEAIQADLEGVGLCLVPGSPDDPPWYVNDEHIAIGNVVVYGERKPNPNGPLFKYKRNQRIKRWEIVRGE